MNTRPGNRILAAISGLFFMMSVLAPAVAGAGTPKIKFKETAWNFGKIKQGEEVSHEFVFSNEGDDTLTIEKVTTTCGCTAAIVSDRSIPPGKSGKIEVTFNSHGYGGQVAKVVYVLSNDPKESQRPLEIKAEVEVPPSPKIEIEPYNYDAGLILEGEEIQANLRIINKGELELRVEFNHRNAAYYVNGKPAPVPLKLASGKETVVLIRIPTPPAVGGVIAGASAEGKGGPAPARIASEKGGAASGEVSAPDRKGRAVREYVLLKSNDPLRSTLSLYISGYIITKEQLRELFEKYKDILR